MRHELEFTGCSPPPGADADAVTHEFVARVSVAEAGDAVLEVGGIATVYDVLVDGVVVLSGRSQFQRHVVDLRALAAGEHEVRVIVHPLTATLDAVPRKPRARWRTMLVEESRLRWVRTQVLGRAPGFSPGPPVVGPVRPMVLATGPRVVAPRLRTSVAGGTGVLEVVAPGAASMSVAGVAAPVVDGVGRVEIPDVELWWPHTHGDPVLHDVLVDGQAAGRVGFRTCENRSADSVDLWLNGVRVFCRGAVWTPGDLSALDEAVTLGLNLVRVPGIGAYESDAFHERCDELGLLVWQDLMFATFDYPLADEQFVADIRSEVADQCDRLAVHPSTAVVCGSAEHEQQAAMFGVAPSTGYAGELASLLRPVVEQSGLAATWVDSSPSGGDPVTRVDTGIAQYFGVGAYLRDLPDARHARVGFAAECLAFSNLPDSTPADGIAGGVTGGVTGGIEQGVPRDNGADWDFADVRRHYLRRRYGPDVADDGPQARRVTGEVMADVFGEWRRPQSGCGGGIVLWLRDLEPGAGWGLLDHTGAPKPAALALAPTLQPTTVWLVDEGLNGLDVHLSHDGPEPENVSLVVELLREDGSVSEAVERSLQLAPRSHQVLGVEALVGRFCDMTWAYRFGPPQQVAVRARLSGGFGERVATWRLVAG